MVAIEIDKLIFKLFWSSRVTEDKMSFDTYGIH
jgi:hypothetical protein